MDYTEQQYDKALLIVNAYETELETLLTSRAEKFRIDLLNYFKENLVDGCYKVKEVNIRKEKRNEHLTSRASWVFVIYTLLEEDDLEENYGGKDDVYISNLAAEHGIVARMYFGYYPK